MCVQDAYFGGYSLQKMTENRLILYLLVSSADVLFSKFIVGA